MMRALRNLFAEVTTTAAVVVALTLAGFGFQETNEPSMAWSGSRRERHLIGCAVCCDIRLPVAEQLRRCAGLADLQRQLRGEMDPDAEKGPATAVAGGSRRTPARNRSPAPHRPFPRSRLNSDGPLPPAS